MKRTLFIVVFVFSIAINLAVGGTLVWHMWLGHAPAAAGVESAPPLTGEEMRVINSAFPENNQASMRETADRLRQKKMEILELVARNPSDFKQAQPGIEELIAIRGQMERQALQRISYIMAQLPPEKRGTFLEFLRNRTCMGPGAGMGMGSCPHCGQGRGPMKGPARRVHERILQQ